MSRAGQQEAPEPLTPDFHQIQTGTGWRRMLDRFAGWCAARPGWRALDVGSGPGYLAARLAAVGCQACAVDLDWDSFYPQRLHSPAAVAEASQLPFAAGEFDLIAASNLLFLLDEPLPVLLELRRCLAGSGQLALLNPSEKMSTAAAQQLADSHQLQGADRASLIHYASRADSGFRWSAPQLARLLASAGFSLLETSPQMGAGLIHFARARPESPAVEVY